MGIFGYVGGVERRTHQFPSFSRVHVELMPVAIPTDLRVMLDDENCFCQHHVRAPPNPQICSSKTELAIKHI